MKNSFISYLYKLRLNDYKIVEFFGLPGSGKTSAARFLLVNGEIQSCNLSWCIIGLSSSGRLRRIFYKVLLVAVHPLVSAQILRACLRLLKNVAHGRLTDFIFAVFNMMFVASVLHTRRRERPLILDQGFLQGCWAILRVLKNDRRQDLEMSTLFEIAYSAFDRDQIVFVYVHCNGHEAKKRTLIRAGLSDELDQDSKSDVKQDEASMLLIRYFVTNLVQAGAICASHDFEGT